VRPILVTGINRSGTTWVGETLARGPGVALLYEPFSPNHRRGVFRHDTPEWFTYVRGDPSGELTADLRRTLTFRYSYTAELPRIRSPRDAARMVRDGARFARWRREGRRPLLKDPIAVLAAPWLAAELEMQVVVTIRHPAAYASSMRRLGWTHDFSGFLRQPGLVDELVPSLRSDIEAMARRPGDILDQAALLWNVIHTVVDSYRRDHPEWSFVRHEDLSAAPDAGFRDLFGRLGVELTPAVERYVAETTGSGNPAEAGRGVIHELRRDSGAAARTWHDRLTPDEVARIRSQTEAVAAAFYGDEDWQPSRSTM
jgi:sulfotransferase family protein